MIDSGVLSGTASEDFDSRFFLRVIAHQAGVPITVISGDTIPRLEGLAREQGLDASDGESFVDFCREGRCIDAIREFSKRVIDDRLSVMNHFPHPLFRLLKDHVAVRAFEVLSALRSAENLEDGQSAWSPFILEQTGFSVLAHKAGGNLYLFGPLFVQDEIGDGADTPYYGPLETELYAFNDMVDSLWQGRLESDEAGTLYTADFLRRVALLRTKLLRASVENKAAFAIKALRSGVFESAAASEPNGSPRLFVKIAAALAATERSGVPGFIKYKRFNSPAGASTAYGIAAPGMKFDFGLREAPPASETYALAYAEAMEISFQNWKGYVAESLGQLRNWLAAGAGPPAETSEVPGNNFGRRLARYMAALFDAYECTIYKVGYQRGRAKLSAIGAFSSDSRGEDRLLLMQRHMESVAGSPLQNNSISFRCLADNRVQYCQYFDYAQRTALPADQPITFPHSSLHNFWGASACAIPIRVNGILWGVLQLIGRRPHSFPDLVRSRAEEACSIVSSQLFRSETINSIYNINAAVGSQRGVTHDAKLIVENSLSRLFGAKTFAILRFDPQERSRVNVFLESGREDLKSAARAFSEDLGYFKPLEDFAKGDIDSWAGEIGEERFRRMFGNVARKRFYESAAGDFAYVAKLHWDLADGGVVPGVVMLTFPHPLGRQDQWRKSIEFACQYVSMISGSLYSGEMWERKLREKIGHELTKTIGNLGGSIQRLEGLRRKAEAALGSDAHIIAQVIGDLNRYTKLLTRYVKILTTHREISDFDNDAHLYLIQEMRSKWQSDGGKRVNFREAYNRAFTGQRKRFAEKGIDFPQLDRSFDFDVAMDELCLDEVLLTLVENLLKYSRPGTAVTVAEQSSSWMKGVTISNIGLKLEANEVNSIFEDETRGMRARAQLPELGKGYGLWFAQRAMHIWGGGLRHLQRDLPIEEVEWAWHDFTIDFNQNLIKQRGGAR